MASNIITLQTSYFSTVISIIIEGQRFVSVSINTCILALCKRVTMSVRVVSISLFESESQSVSIYLSEIGTNFTLNRVESARLSLLKELSAMWLFARVVWRT